MYSPLQNKQDRSATAMLGLVLILLREQAHLLTQVSRQYAHGDKASGWTTCPPKVMPRELACWGMISCVMCASVIAGVTAIFTLASASAAYMHILTQVMQVMPGLQRHKAVPKCCCNNCTSFCCPLPMQSRELQPLIHPQPVQSNSLVRLSCLETSSKRKAKVLMRRVRAPAELAPVWQSPHDE